jgi:thymidylate synthase ThyX
MPSRKVYLLSPRELSPETIAVAFAKTSRSPESFREIAAELTDESSARFHEKWVVGYGHASVAEHAVLHVAIENVSRLAVECIESNRLASYTEKSTRYQKWDPDAFFIPPELIGHPLLETYISTCRTLFDAYAQSVEPVKALVAAEDPPRQGETSAAHERRIRSQIVDSCRFLLPAASLANLGMTANARVLEHAISKMLSHPLLEVQAIGAEIKHAAQAEVPTLLKYADPLPALMATGQELASLEIEYHAPASAETPLDWCLLHQYDPEGESKVIAAALQRFSEMSFSEALQTVRLAGHEEQEQMAARLLARLGEHEAPLRELEHTTYTFEILLDQGGYAEFKRHRMMTQTPQTLTARLGYATPRRLVEAGFEAPYREAMQKAAQAYERLAAWDAQVAAYLVPNGFNRRILFSLNLRQAFAFCRLRAAPNAHFSLRRLAQRLAAEIRRVHPLLGMYLRLPDESWQEIDSNNLK